MSVGVMDEKFTQIHIEPVARCPAHAGLVTKSCPTLATPRTVVRQASLSMQCSRQEPWSGLPFPPPGDLPDPRNRTQVSRTAGRLFTDRAMRDAHNRSQ